MNARSAGSVDVVGVGLNATDTIIRLPYFPAPDSKVEVRSSEVRAGGQVASAVVACRRWGFRRVMWEKSETIARGNYKLTK